MSVCRRCNGPRLPLSPMDRSDNLAFARSFLLLLLLLCVAPSNIEGEDHSFLRHQRTPLKLPPPTMSSSIASTVVAIAIHNFRRYHYRYRHLQLPPSQQLSSERWLPKAWKRIKDTAVHSIRASDHLGWVPA
ncbi:unnamed protein product [Musa hybrid cultivar]